MAAEAPQTALVAGARLEWTWAGPGPDEAPTILLMHEGLGCIAMWRDFPAELARRTGCGVLTYSRQGYGGSDPVDLPRPLTYMHDEAFNVVGRLIDHFKLREVILAGHSDGASIAAIYGGGVSDERIKGLILISPHFFNEDLCVKTISEARESYEKGDLKARLQRYHGDNVDCAFYGWNGAWLDPGFLQWNLEEFLPTIKAPVLLVWGANDPYGTIAQVHAAERQCGSPLEVCLLENSTHWPFREQSEETFAAIETFITGLREDIAP